MNLAIYVLNIAVLLSVVLDLRTDEADRRLSFSIVRILLILPLLVGTYFSSYYFTAYYILPFFYNSENVFSLLLIMIADRLHKVSSAGKKDFFPFRLLFAAGLAAVLTAAGYAHFHLPGAGVVDGILVFPHYGIVYCSSLFLLLAVMLLGWRVEVFWRSLDAGEKWRYKYLVLGLFLVCAMLGWSSSYRLAYLGLPREHFLLLSVILLIAWMGMIYSVARHRLLNRKLFVSRKVVYATIAPIAFSVFFILVGIMAMLTRFFGWSIPFVLQWLVIILGILAIVVLAFSGSVRKRVKYYVSTHFYVNKYEYRDEWLAFSDLLQGKLSEKGVVEALYRILRDSLYTYNIMIWLGDIQKGFQRMEENGRQHRENVGKIPGDDPIVCYLHNAPYLYSHEGDDDPLRCSILKEREFFLQAHDIVLMVPLILGNQCVGLIGLGPEATGGRYGHDDFDLLAALSSHAASALLALQNAEKLARTREQSVWNKLSAFVLHDIKNAATMLDLVRKNAPQHLNNPEFQKDMLDSIDDALRRMGKVQACLSALKGEMTPNIQAVKLNGLLQSCCERHSKKLSDMTIEVECPEDLFMDTDPEFLSQILENLFLNAREAGATILRISAVVKETLRIVVADNGPGILPDLLPQALFEPFKTTKTQGSGIGLWQVRQLVESLGGDIHTQNAPGCGAQFTIQFKA